MPQDSLTSFLIFLPGIIYTCSSLSFPAMKCVAICYLSVISMGTKKSIHQPPVLTPMPPIFTANFLAVDQESLKRLVQPRQRETLSSALLRVSKDVNQQPGQYVIQESESTIANFPGSEADGAEGKFSCPRN